MGELFCNGDETCTVAFFGGLFMSIWVAAILEIIPICLCHHKTHLYLFPIYLIIVFGLYSLSVIAYRVATFTDCTEDALELKRQIIEAKQDLLSKGFVFDKT